MTVGSRGKCLVWKADTERQAADLLLAIDEVGGGLLGDGSLEAASSWDSSAVVLSAAALMTRSKSMERPAADRRSFILPSEITVENAVDSVDPEILTGFYVAISGEQWDTTIWESEISRAPQPSRQRRKRSVVPAKAAPAGVDSEAWYLALSLGQMLTKAITGRPNPLSTATGVGAVNFAPPPSCLTHLLLSLASFHLAQKPAYKPGC
jgi:hypothetical protein